MYPTLLHIGPFPIHSYGFLIAIGFLVAISVLKRLAHRAGLNQDRVLDLAFWCLIVGFLGARTLFIITRFEDFWMDPVSIFKVWEGGLVFWWLPLVAIPFVFWYVRRFKLPLWLTLDVLAPALVINHAFGRLGCLAAGCCYGKPTGTSFGVKLESELVERALRGIPLHPTQLYECGALLILFLGLLFLLPRKSFDGQVALTYLMSYSVIRSVIEIFRGDLIRGFVIEGVLSTSQFISLGVFLLTLAVLIFRLKQEEKSSGG